MHCAGTLIMKRDRYGGTTIGGDNPLPYDYEGYSIAGGRFRTPDRFGTYVNACRS